MKNGICKLCGKEFPRYHSQQLYCSKYCYITAKNARCAIQNRMRYKAKPKIKTMICTECGRQYMGHFNSKYCDNCIPWRYEQNRTNMESEMNAPCFGCSERHPLCHDHCEKYRDFKQQREVELTARKHECAWYNYAVDNSQRVKKAQRRRKSEDFT